MEVVRVNCLSDNYGWLVRCKATGAVASIDAPEAGPLKRELKERGWKLTHILNTHHHADHTGGTKELCKEYGCEVVGYADDAERLPGITKLVRESDTVSVGNLKARVIFTPGHTLGHICYYFEEEATVFVGDMLFMMGCGRVFEGTHEMMYNSILKLDALPDETAVYCAHEYTQSNTRFAASVDKGNSHLAARIEEVAKLRAAGQATVPSTIGLEKATNPFLRFRDPSLRKNLDHAPSTPDLAVFSDLRTRKDTF